MIPVVYQQDPSYCGIANLDSSLVVALSIDVTLQLANGQVPTSPVSTLTNVDRGTNYATALVSTPTVSGNIITQEIGPVPVGDYILKITYTPSPAAFVGETLAVILGVVVPA